MFKFNIFNKKEEPAKINTHPKKREEVALRKGEIGEYKTDLQLTQLPKEYKYISDLVVANKKAKSGYSQIDHAVITPYGIFVIETKNYQGTIYVSKAKRTWSINGQFQMMNPFHQNFGHVEALKQLLAEDCNFISVVSFTKRCTFKNGEDYRHISSNELLIYDIELTEYIHRKVSVLKLTHKQPLFNEVKIAEIFNLFSQANITDPIIRQQHVRALQERADNKAPGKVHTSYKTTHKCVICEKKVTEKVSAFCLSNKKFNGKVYCFEHQKI